MLVVEWLEKASDAGGVLFSMSTSGFAQNVNLKSLHRSRTEVCIDFAVLMVVTLAEERGRLLVHVFLSGGCLACVALFVVPCFEMKSKIQERTKQRVDYQWR